MQLKWDQGLASRGRLKGQKTFGDTEILIAPSRLANIEFVDCTQESRRRKRAEKPAANAVHAETRQCSVRNKRNAARKQVKCARPSALTLSMPMPLPELLAKSEHRQLFEYYVNHVSVITVVKDSERNPFRHILPRLAFQSPLIMFNILAIASANLANTHPNHPLTEGTFQYLSRVHTLLQQRLRDPDLCLSEITLAAILGQVSYQLHHGSVSHWRIHLTAARGIVNALGGPKRLLQLPSNGGYGTTPNSHWRFYVQHLAWLDILAATTSNTKKIGSAAYWEALIDATQNPQRSERHSVDTQQDDNTDESYGMSDLMGCSEEILGIIAEMTRRYDDFCSSPAEMLSTTFEQESERAQRATSDTTAELKHLEAYYTAKLDALAPANQPTTPREALHELFRSSARIYLHYRILQTPCYSLTVQSLLSQAIALLPIISSPSPQEYGLPWPLFILGSVSIYSLQQKVVQSRYEHIAKHMGFGNQQRCLELLLEVWESWREAERVSRARTACLEEKDMGRRRWEVVMRDKNWELLLA
jgi:hypothetical protein